MHLSIRVVYIIFLPLFSIYKVKPEEYNAKPKLHLESYMAIASYGSIDPCQLSFETGELLEIVEKYDDGKK